MKKYFISYTAQPIDGKGIVVGNCFIELEGTIKNGDDINTLQKAIREDSPSIIGKTTIINFIEIEK